jgi:catechol 2,3-dioxygenase-like lactoylglutathione lyase family enzyme
MDTINYEVSYVRISVQDMEIAREFYEDVLGMPMMVDRSDDGYFLMSLGCTTLIVEKTSPEEVSLPPGRYLGISLKVEGIEQIYETLQKEGVHFSNAPEKQFWGGYLTEFSDPDGNVWTLLG